MGCLEPLGWGLGDALVDVVHDWPPTAYTATLARRDADGLARIAEHNLGDLTATVDTDETGDVVDGARRADASAAEAVQLELRCRDRDGAAVRAAVGGRGGRRGRGSGHGRYRRL
jgi:hypothetical protein